MLVGVLFNLAPDVVRDLVRGEIPDLQDFLDDVDAETEDGDEGGHEEDAPNEDTTLVLIAGKIYK